MDRSAMLARCIEGQWRLDDVDWSQPKATLPAQSEREIVQYFTDMAQIERFAGALFEEQRRRTRDPVLAKIFATFVADEERHARAAERLAERFDQRQLRAYAPSPSLLRFKPRFLRVLAHLSEEIANAYIVAGELLLDIALLRSIDDYVDDPVCHDVMKLINRDESRHVAVDYHMVDYYSSPEWQRELAKRPARSPREHASAALAFAGVLATARPFIVDVFIEPMTRVDPTRRRMREAFKRMQLLGAKPGVAARPFSRFLRALRFLYRTRATHAVFGRLAERIVGVPGEYLRDLYTAEEWDRAAGMTLDQLADDALAAKYDGPA
ncbi:MAG: ferritin-like domain-containing protein [Polyangiaceae bacterium]|nr:ferritin-like domain-containing protein [Polyangiaceae bacterium]MBK8942082.1 ferritin-like domain-containing protein [Polyangiaceae bacterium]